MKVRNPLGSLRLPSAFAAAASPTFLSVAVATLVAANCQNAQAQFQLPPPANTSPQATASPATPAPSLLPSTTDGATKLTPANPLRDRAVALSAEAKLAVSRGDIATARRLLGEANSLRVPEGDFAANQLRPWQVAMDLKRLEDSRSGTPVSVVQPAGGMITGNQNANAVQTGVYQPGQDASAVQPAAAQFAIGSGRISDEPNQLGINTDETGESLYRDGLAALTSQNKQRALELFTAAWKKEAEMDPLVRAQLKDKLTALRQNDAPPRMSDDQMPPAMAAISQEQALLRQKMFREVTTEIAEAERMVDSEPVVALQRLQALRQRVSQSSIEGNSRKEYLAMVDRVINNVDAFIKQNKSTIEQQQRNVAVEDSIIAEGAHQAAVNSEIQRLVDQFNELNSTNRFAEAEVVARKIRDLDPNSEISSVMVAKAKIARAKFEGDRIREIKENGFLKAMEGVEIASAGIDDSNIYQMPTDWAELSKRRLTTDELTMSPSERMIRQKLAEPVSVSFQARPLGYAIDTISQMTGIPIVPDPLGLAAEGLTMDQPVSLELNGQSISLKSALNLLLESLNLTYVVKDEVLKITSRSTISREKRVQTYPVADLVIPVPNFTSDSNDGFSNAMQAAYATQAGLMVSQQQQRSGVQIARNAAAQGMDPNTVALGQLTPQGFGGSPNMGGGSFGGGGGGFNSGNNPLGGGGGNQYADFTQLIDLIQTTIPGEWDVGEDTIREFPANLSLIVSAPLETHEQIAQLLKSLRALQNLQVTIEIRFITLNDDFFERMGVDFDFNIDDNAGTRPGIARDDSGPSTAIGLATNLSGFGGATATSDLDVQFRQDSFVGAVPSLGSAAANIGNGAQLGFAILSDLELYFFLNAAQGDSRTNVMQAPKLTMFDGQIASIQDGSSVPFVTGLTPIVGDFAVAQQPIIVLLHDGTKLDVQSVVTQDKRFVRMTLAPSFTNVRDRDRVFTFSGSRSSDSGSVVVGPNGDPLPNPNNQTQNFVGSTVQLPTLAQTIIQTTVTVPDGGTILLGGIKRLTEQRVEQGVPMLSKIPYLNRLFSNVGVSRTANTLMMTVTPRIIIPQEEEERVLGGSLLP